MLALEVSFASHPRPVCVALLPEHRNEGLCGKNIREIRVYLLKVVSSLSQKCTDRKMSPTLTGLRLNTKGSRQCESPLPTAFCLPSTSYFLILFQTKRPQERGHGNCGVSGPVNAAHATHCKSDLDFRFHLYFYLRLNIDPDYRRHPWYHGSLA